MPILPEQWSHKNVPFLEIKDWNTLKIRLQRTPCFGSCPVYTVEIRGNGETDFEGSYNVLITGHHHGTISKQSLQNLVAEFHHTHYLSLKDSYEWMVSDFPTCTSSIEVDGVKKSVVDTLGSQAGMPDVAIKVEEAIDQFGGTKKWIKGKAQTGPALIAEHWDFQSSPKKIENSSRTSWLSRIWFVSGRPMVRRR